MFEFNEGDYVRAKVSSSSSSNIPAFVAGEIYKVTKYYSEFFPYGKGEYRIRVEKDSNGIANGWSAENFKLVRRKGEFKVGDIVSWRDIPYWQNAIVRKVEGTKVYADSEGKNTVSGEGLFKQDVEFYELTIVKPVECQKTTVTLTSEGKVLLTVKDFNFFADLTLSTKEKPKNYELTVNEARAIAGEIDESIVNVIAVYDELIEQGFKITKD